MNIIKFKSIDVDLQAHPEFEVYDQWYKESLRGKYAYWVRFRYIVPLDSISTSMYVTSEIDINDLLGYNYYVLRNVDGELIYVPKSHIYISDKGETELQDPEYPHPGKDDFVLVEEIPEHPTENDLPFIKIHSSAIKYIDLWDEMFWEGVLPDPRENWLKRDYIDDEETNKINDISWYLKYNSHMPGGSVSLDDLKKFRTWLADELLDIMGDSLSIDNRHILEYYDSDNNMMDDTVKWLTYFGGKDIEMKQTSVSPCGCTGNGNLSSLYNESLSVCDPVSIYRSNIKNGMITLFSNIDTWANLPEGELDEIITYIDGIINANLPLVNSSTDIYNFYTCGCLQNSDFAQAQAQSLLGELKNVFIWIKAGDITGHKNSIATTLTTWASTLYENMYWN